MQIQNQIVSPNLAANLPQLKVGDTLQVMVKERVDNQSAIVSMKGTTAMVQFEGGIPEQDKVFVEITGKTAKGNYIVKMSDQVLESSSSGTNTSQETDSNVDEAVKAFTSRGVSLSKEDIASIREFLTGGKGSVEQKMEALRMMAQKRIAISKHTLQAVHEALNGRPLSSTLKSVLDELGVNYQPNRVSSTKTLERVRAEIQREPDLSKVMKVIEDFLKSTDLDVATKRLLETSLSEAKRLAQSGQSINARVQLIQTFIALEKQNMSVGIAQIEESSVTTKPSINNSLEEAIQNVVKDVQKEPSLTKVLEKTAALIAEYSSNENIEQLKQAYEKAQQLQENGRELAARREISNALTKLEQSVVGQFQQVTKNTVTEAEQYAINEAVQTLKLDSQNVLVTEITKKLSQLAIDFKQLKQEVAKNLDNVSKMLENRNILPQANVKQILEATIHKLDNAILKGDFLLYTDMSTEKKLLSASSQLAEAKKLLAKGETVEANRLVKEVKANIEAILFKPSNAKVKHFVSDKLGLESFSSSKQLTSTLNQVVQPFSGGGSSSRQMYEAIRSLGLTHETEAGFSLVSKLAKPMENIQSENVKATLLKMMKNEEMKPQMMQQIEQAVNSITGQQLLNKQDSSGMQNLFFQLPHLIEKQVENIKIYVNSRKNGDKMDWENCSLYFVLETKKLGEVGVLLSSTEKNVSLTFKSNKDRLAEKVSNLTEATQERFSEIGYNLNTMNVKPLHEKDEVSNMMERAKSEAGTTPDFTKKGYDFSI
ncbi:hypothetical protein [Peribacillus sp. Hz7]|uniref:hypothetical protein n=1 Tax=Peribacillus sp. Hz7 TaxID=3344873 RepID=UPI0035CC9F19